MSPFPDVKDKTKSAVTHTKAVYSQRCHQRTQLPSLMLQQGFKELEEESAKRREPQSLDGTFSIRKAFWKQGNILVDLVLVAALG